MSDINLLPQEFKPKGYALKATSSLKKLEIIFGAVFVIFLILMVVTNVVLGIRSQGTEKKISQLKNEIEALVQTEQKLILVQDRVTKIKSINNYDNAYDELAQVQSLIQTLPQEVQLKGVSAEKDKSSITVTAKDSKSLTSYFNFVTASEIRKVDLTSFKYDYKSGYEVEISFSRG